MDRLLLIPVLSLVLLTGVTATVRAETARRPRQEVSSTTMCPPGFSALQGSDTCVRISGRVRAETVIGSARTRSDNAFGSSASGRIQLDMRKQTEYGPLRAVIRADGRR